MPAHSQVGDPFVFFADWAWGLPLIVLTVVIHVVGLGVLSQRAVRARYCVGAVTPRPHSLHPWGYGHKNLVLEDRGN